MKTTETEPEYSEEELAEMQRRIMTAYPDAVAFDVNKLERGMERAEQMERDAHTEQMALLKDINTWRREDGPYESDDAEYRALMRRYDELATRCLAGALEITKHATTDPAWRDSQECMDAIRELSRVQFRTGALRSYILDVFRRF